MPTPSGPQRNGLVELLKETSTPAGGHPIAQVIRPSGTTSRPPPAETSACCMPAQSSHNPQPAHPCFRPLLCPPQIPQNRHPCSLTLRLLQKVPKSTQLHPEMKETKKRKFLERHAQRMSAPATQLPRRPAPKQTRPRNPVGDADQHAPTPVF